MKKIWINVDPENVDFSYLIDHFKGRCEIIAKKVPNDPAQYLPLAQNADVVICGTETWDATTLPQIKGKVGFLQRFGMGYDSINVPEATKNGILVANIQGANSAAVAEVALFHMMNLNRGFTDCMDAVNKGIWEPSRHGFELDGKTVGLLGFGNIARNLARMLSGFRVKILTFDPYISSCADFPDVEFVKDKMELFERSDIISLHIPCTAETAGSINKSVFDHMKQGAYLINTCRGGVINELDLIEALNSGKLGGAGLDVLVEEPPKQDNPLLHMKNVYITSHMGANSAEAVHRSLVAMGEAIDTFLAGGIPKFAKNPEVLKKA